MLDRLMCGPIFAKSDRIVGADVDHRQPHEAASRMAGFM